MGKTVTIRYVGPHWAVELTAPDGSDHLVERGETFETTPEHAEALLIQESNWQPEKPAKRSAKAEKEGVE
jgi:hypothetical protein